MTQNSTQQPSMSAQQAFAKHLAQNAYVNNPFTQQAPSGVITPVTSVLHPLSLAMPVMRSPAVQKTQSTNNYSNQNLSLFSSMEALNLVHAAVRNAQQSNSNALPAVDMLVFPTSTASEQEQCSDAVQVSYTTAEDLADSIFPTSVAHKELSSRVDEHAKFLKDLSTHRDLAHEGLLDHKKQVKSLHKSMRMADEGLINHRVNISKLNQHMAHADEGLLDHRVHINKLNKHMLHADEGLIDHSVHINKLNKHMSQADEGLLDHRVHINKLNKRMSQADEGLLDHRVHINKLNQHMLHADEGLLDHRTHIGMLNTHMINADEGLRDHRDQLRSLHKSMRSVEDERHEHSQQIASLDEHQKTTDTALCEHQSHILKLQNDNVSTSMQLKSHEAEMKRMASVVKSLGAGSNNDIDQIRVELQQLQLDAGKMHKGLTQHTNVLDSQHEVLQQLKSTKTALQQSQHETRSQITNLSKSLDSTRDALQQSQQDTSSKISNLTKSLATRNVDVVQAPRRR